MKLILCGPIGASVGFLAGYLVPFFIIPGQTDIARFSRLYVQLYSILIGIILGTWLPTLLCLWFEKSEANRNGSKS
jgi:hypothetical protein